MENNIIFETRDGSHSILSDKYGVSYHSKYGAIQESRHVFIEAGLQYVSLLKKDISILDIGFGSGLNAFLTLLEGDKEKLDIFYEAVEAYPITLEQARQLNYPQQLAALDFERIFLDMHCLEWEKTKELKPGFQFKKTNSRFEELDYEIQFDLIYYDAFGPDTQPLLWETPVLSKMYKALKPGGVFVTYSAKGSVKRILKALGFTVEALKGPPGKREMTRALK